MHSLNVYACIATHIHWYDSMLRYTIMLECSYRLKVMHLFCIIYIGLHAGNVQTFMSL